MSDEVYIEPLSGDPNSPECLICGEPCDFVADEEQGALWRCSVCGHEFHEPAEENLGIELDPDDDFGDGRDL